MKIIEVRDGIIKLECDEAVVLSSFIKAECEEKSYIAQIIQIKPQENLAFAKILFLYDDELLDYDKSSPEQDAIITDFTSEMLEKALKAEEPLIAGKTLDEKHNITVDLSMFDKKTVVSVDDSENKNLIVQNLSKQFNNLGKNVIVIDTLGLIKANKYIAGKDFKLPLDKSSLIFMYEECLSDATADSKSTIVEIFRDLAEYSQTVDFLPFDSLKTVVDDMVDKSHVFKLLVLKNKLSKFEKQGYFAKNKTEADKINYILNSKCSIIDISKLDIAFQNRYISYIYEKLNDDKSQVILELSNIISKKCLKKVFDSKIATTFITHSGFKYLNDIRTMFDNYMIFPSEGNNRLFSIYSTFLRSMPKRSFLIAGEGTNYIPFISVSKLINEYPILPTNNEAVFDELINSNENENENENENAVVLSEETETPPEILSEVVDSVQVPADATDEIINSIDEKSMNTISDIAENLEESEEIEMFGDEEAEDEITEDAILESGELSEGEFEHSDDLTSVADLTDEDLSVNDEFENDSELQLEEEADEEQKTSDTEDIIEPEFTEKNTSELTEPDEAGDNSDIQEDIDESEIQDTEFLDEISISDMNVENNYESIETNYSESDEISTIELGEDIDLDLDTEITEEVISPESADEALLNTELEEEKDIEPVQAEQTDNFVEPQIIPLNGDEFGEIEELNPDEADENDILIDMSEDYEPQNVDEEIKREVDKVYTTRKEEAFSETDLDLIDELNSEDDTLPELLPEENDELLEEISDDDSEIMEYHSESEEENIVQEEPEILETRNSSTPIVPVYDADIPQEDMVESDPIQQGDSVTHVKYGNGVVEKLVKYGNKTLYMINFDTDGRKLLDPLLTEIKKA